MVPIKKVPIIIAAAAVFCDCECHPSSPIYLIPHSVMKLISSAPYAKEGFYEL